MCRWLAYLGQEIPLEDVIVRPNHSLIDQSLLARESILPGGPLASQFRNHDFPTNGDGFGIAWRGRNGTLGQEIPLEDVIVRPNHSLIDQSLLARESILPGGPLASQFRNHDFPTNGDGFGIAWRGRNGTLGQYRQTTPAWDSQNLRHLAAQIESGCFLSHVRAAPGGSIAEQNCHPFVHDGWMFQHNGEINGFRALKRSLTFDVAPELYPFIQGSSDTEVCFFLALTYGLAHDPVGALTQMIHRVERARAEFGVAEPFRAAMCASDGTRLIVLRWVSPDGAAAGIAPPSLFTLRGETALRAADGMVDHLPTDAHLVVSEPLELHWSPQTWHEVPANTIGVVRHGEEPTFIAIDPLATATAE